MKGWSNWKTVIATKKSGNKREGMLRLGYRGEVIDRVSFHGYDSQKGACECDSSP